jgi:hypothetical protein
MKRFYKPEPAVRFASILIALAALAGCPGPGPDTARSLVSIAISSEPAKTEYVKGEALDLSGLEVIATWSDGKTGPAEIAADNISYDGEAVGDVAVTVTVDGKSAVFWIVIVDPASEALAFVEAHAAVLELIPESINGENAADHEAGVDAALAAYHALGGAARTLAAPQKAALDALKLRVDGLLASDRADAFKAAYAGILAKTADTVALEDEAAVDAALAAHQALSEAAKARAAAEKILLDALKQTIGNLREKAEFRSAHAAVLALTVETVTAEDRDALDAALAAYEALSEADKALTGAEKTLLEDLKRRAGDLAEKAAFRSAHAEVLALVMDTVTPGNEAAVDGALAAYAELGEDVRALAAAEKALLEVLKLRIADLRAAENADEADKAAAARFTATHAAILAKTADTLAVNDEAAVDAALGAHALLPAQARALTGAQKSLLEGFKTEITGMKALAAFKTEHAVILGTTIDAVAAADEAAVDAALGAHAALPAQARAAAGAQKSLLEGLKTKITDMKAAAAFKTEHAVILGTTLDAVAAADEAAVNAGITAHNALSAGVKALLAPEKALLDRLIQKIESLNEAASYRTEADGFKTAHAAILGRIVDTITVADETAVDAALGAYNALGAGAMALLSAEKEKLDSFKTAIMELKAPAEASAFKAAHAAVLSKIPASVTAGDEAAVNAALLAHSSLSAPAKTLAAAEKTLLESLRQTITTLKDSAADQAAAASFTTAHAAVLAKTPDTVVISDEAAVDAAIAAYNALRPGAKPLLAAGTQERLDALKAKIALLIEREGIFTAADLAKIGVDPAYPANGSYTLMADLTLNNWTPLCPTEANPFSGTFDGNRHTIAITGFSGNAVQYNSYIGLFGYVKGTSSSAQAAIRNLKIVSSVDASTARDGGQSLGLAAGYANAATIENISLQGSLRYSSLIGVVYVGGVSGWIEGAVVKDCSSSMNIHITGGFDVPLDPNIVIYSSIGGFVGLFKNHSEIRDCHNTGNITGYSPRPSSELLTSRGPVGDGSVDGPTVNDPNHAQVYVGGIAGGSYFAFEATKSGNIYNCSSYGDMTAIAEGWWAFASGISGCFNIDSLMEYCTAGGVLYAQSEFAYAGGMTSYAIGLTGSGATYYRCKFVGNIKAGAYYTYGPITGQYGQVVECEWDAAAATPEPVPQARIDWSGKLAGLGANMEYTVNNASKTADASGSITIEESWLGTTISIVKQRVFLYGSAHSPPQSLAVPSRPAAPAGLTAASQTINGVNSSMEWAPYGTAGTDNAAWTSCSGNSVTGLAPGSYYVRYKHTGSAFASANAALAVSLNIMSAEDLDRIGVDPLYPANGIYILAADVHLNNWTPRAFTGSLDGRGRRITINSFNPGSLDSIGIFSTITGPSYEMPAVIENLTISVGSGAYAALNGLAPTNVGTLAGSALYVRLNAVHVEGSAIAFNANDSAAGGMALGGIVGSLSAGALKDCSNSAPITASAGTVGGIAGSVSGQGLGSSAASSLVEACHASGSISTASAWTPYASVGGITGSVNQSTVKRSYFAGAITVSRGNDSVVSDTMTAIGGIAGRMEHNSAIEDCHSSGAFAVTSTNSSGGTNNGIALGGVAGRQERNSTTVIQRCYSIADLRVQRNSKAYAGGIVGSVASTPTTGYTARITVCAALNGGIQAEYASGGIYGLHRVAMGNPVLSRNIAWHLMPLSVQQTGQAAQPFTEANADKTGSGLAGEDWEAKPTQQDYVSMNWNFSAVWRMGGNGYPELQ